MTLPSTQDFDAEEIDRGSRQGQTNDNPSADLVRVYLNGIGKTALLTAEDEVQLAQTIELVCMQSTCWKIRRNPLLAP